jgi:branched-chain amino acid transport system permease protein
MPQKQNKKNHLVDFKAYLKAWINTFRAKVTLICLIGFFILPFISTNDYIIGIFNTFMIYTIFAASWDFLAGYVGQVSFGHAIFLGVSAYVTAYITRFIPLAVWDFSTSDWIIIGPMPWWITLLLSASIAVLFGLIVGVPSLRLKGPYLALGTLAMSLILYEIFKMASLGTLWTNAFPGTVLFGTNGIGQVLTFSNIPNLLYITIFIIMCITLIFLTHLVKSNTGTILKAIRDDETGTKTSGINTTKYKIMAFMISGFIAGIAGSLFVLRTTGVNPGVFQPLYSFYAIIIAAIGGLASISGSALGAFIFVFLGEFLRLLGDNPNITGAIGGFVEPIFVFSIILILIIRFTEHGILKPALERLQDLWDLVIGR